MIFLSGKVPCTFRHPHTFNQTNPNCLICGRKKIFL